MTSLPYTPPAHTGLDILFQDDHLLIVNKPTGLLAVPGRGEDKQDCLSTRVQTEFPDALIVHRLDMATSGLLIFARGMAMQRTLSGLFERREIEKQYVALVAGKLAQIAGEIDLPLGADWEHRPRQRVDFERGKPAQTHFQVLSYNEPHDTSRVALTPITGRTHQLRVHLLAIGHPILGDSLYGGREAQRSHLHATALYFNHPQTGEVLNLQCAPSF
ncbi:MAG: pseudouridine synthase [Gallionella sp.]|nr:pseudouridine synthase [Gallionella sp.]MDD4957723.1 pseudouridine synthase [Gallionella sp.]